MTPSATDPTRQLRWSIYVLLIALAVGNLSGRLLVVNSVDYARLESYRIGKQLDSFREKLIEEGLSGPGADRASRRGKKASAAKAETAKALPQRQRPQSLAGHPGIG